MSSRRFPVHIVPYRCNMLRRPTRVSRPFPIPCLIYTPRLIAFPRLFAIIIPRPIAVPKGEVKYDGILFKYL